MAYPLTGDIGDRWGIGDCWCYLSYPEAKAALDAWDGTGEPQGWIRHPSTGRRVSQSPDEYDADDNRVGVVGVTYVRP